jgi:hypothetical protein
MRTVRDILIVLFICVAPVVWAHQGCGGEEDVDVDVDGNGEISEAEARLLASTAALQSAANIISKAMLNVVGINTAKSIHDVMDCNVDISSEINCANGGSFSATGWCMPRIDGSKGLVLSLVMNSCSEEGYVSSGTPFVQAKFSGEEIHVDVWSTDFNMTGEDGEVIIRKLSSLITLGADFSATMENQSAHTVIDDIDILCELTNEGWLCWRRTVDDIEALMYRVCSVWGTQCTGDDTCVKAGEAGGGEDFSSYCDFRGEDLGCCARDVYGAPEDNTCTGGYWCTDHFECTSNLCIEGICTNPCKFDNSQCPLGSRCLIDSQWSSLAEDDYPDLDRNEWGICLCRKAEIDTSACDEECTRTNHGPSCLTDDDCTETGERCFWIGGTTGCKCCIVPFEACDNGIDDDSDGDIDCDDTDCFDDPDCVDVETDCGNNEDDDGDGFRDCDDCDCLEEPACTGRECCNNGEDDDNNGSTDCDDDECKLEPPCFIPPQSM